MNSLTNDEWSYIMSFIENNNDKCNLLKACKQMGSCNFYFYGLVHLIKISKSIWYDKFINVIVHDLVALPLHIKSLTFSYYFDLPIKDYIPSSITHLSFGYFFDQPIKDCIPSGVTHLSFGHWFTQPIKDCITLGVTHLTFGYRFNQPIKDCIPSSVKYLEFKGKYKHSIEKSAITDVIIDGINIKKIEK